MKYDLPVEGRVVRVQYSEKDNGKGGVYRNGTVVLRTEFEKLEVELENGSSAGIVAKLRALEGQEGQDVRLLVGVASGDKWTSPARLFFLDDLTPRK